MKNILWVALGFMVAVLAFGIAGFAYAQSQTPATPEYPHIHGMMGDAYDHDYGHGMMGDAYDHDYGHGMMGGHGLMGCDGEEGPMHDAMVAALAQALDLTPEELEARHDAGETMWQIAESEGLNADEIQDLMLSAHDSALEDAVADGQLTEEQASWMDTHMDQMWGGENVDGGFGGHCEGGGWNVMSPFQGEN